jgi:hypothetical protein
VFFFFISNIYIENNIKKQKVMKNIIRLTESELKQLVSESVKQILKEKQKLNEAISHLGYWERNTNPRTMDMLFSRQRQIIEYDLKKAGLNLPFVVRNYADYNMAVDIPVSAIKSFSDELVELYGNELAAVNPKGSKVFRRNSYEPYEGYNRLSHLYTDDYINGGMHREFMSPETAEKYRNDPNIKFTGRKSNWRDNEEFYGSLMPKPRKEYDDLRNEVLAIKAIMEKAGYKVRITHENFFDKWDDETDDYSNQKFVRFILQSDELDRYRDNQYNTPEHMAAAEREHEMERRSEMAYEMDWARRNGEDY